TTATRVACRTCWTTLTATGTWPAWCRPTSPRSTATARIRRPLRSARINPNIDQGGTLSTEHKQTEEQIAIGDAAATGDNVLVEAGAGCGKTTKLKQIAKRYAKEVKSHRLG